MSTKLSAGRRALSPDWNLGRGSQARKISATSNSASAVIIGLSRSARRWAEVERLRGLPALARVPVIEGALFFSLAPEDFIVSIGVKRRVDVDQIEASIGQLRKLLDVVPAINDASVHHGRRFHFPVDCSP